ncbi:MAG: sugar ABC transporter substrate-binding protein, partial [Oscillospiraceae bacterium]|nr:sugar ABC transporter substrate-binding protein [Oscillospiraceae bacterium]
MKKTLTIILALAMALSLAACGTAGSESTTDSPAPNGSAAPEASYVVGFSNVDDIYSYCAKFRDYLVEECKAQGIEVIVTNAGGDANVMNGQVEDMISQEAKIVSTIACNPDGNTPALESARSAKLPYVAFLNSIKGGDDYDGYIYIGSQNYDAGTMQGKYLAENLPENAKVIYLTGSLSNQENLDRKNGMMDALKDRTDIEFIAEYDVDSKKDRAMSTTEDCLQAFDSFDAIVCQNDDAALGVVEALKAANRLEGVITVGID